MANDVLVDLEASTEKYQKNTVETDLMDWLKQLTNPWREYRDNNFKNRWNEYYRLWRGIFKECDRTRSSERSKLISPALQQAIEAIVSEIEEAIFGAGRWFDVRQDIMDAADEKQKATLSTIMKRLEEDMENVNIRGALGEIFLLGALFGTGIGKILIGKRPYYEFNKELALEKKDRWCVSLEPVEPRDFLCDPTARCIDESIGVVHELMVPKSDVLEKMTDGIYRKVEIGSVENDKNDGSGGSNKFNLNNVKIFEYHGYVPRSLLPPEVAPDEEFEDLTGAISSGNDEASVSKAIDLVDDELVEAIVVIANDSILLKAKENPLPRADRGFISYQHDTVPNRFWGRGVAEKGYNPQKALDAELRGRIDAMSYAIRPMMAMDATKMPRGMRFDVEAGKTVLTNGNPRDVFMPFTLGSVNQATFPQAQDLERMVQMGTGAVDTAQMGSQPIGSNVGGMNLLSAASIKRTKRTLANIERNLISPLIHKLAWRYMFFDEERYPAKDLYFTVKASLGMMAKELESQQYMNMLKTVSADSPAYWILMKGVYENSSLGNRDEMVAMVDQMIESTMNPPEPTPDPMVEITKMDIQSRAQQAQVRAQLDAARIRLDALRVNSTLEKDEAQVAKLQAESMKLLAEIEAMDLNIATYEKEVDAIKAKSTNEDNTDDTTRAIS